MTTEQAKKNQEGQEKENPKQKYFIIGFAVIAVIALAIFVLRKDDFTKTEDAFLKAWQTKNQKKILSLASKQIVIGQLDSENSITQESSKALPILLKVTEKTVWLEGYKETESGDNRLRIVISNDESEQGNFQLLFSQNEQGKWFWSGFLTSHLEDFAELLNSSSNNPSNQYKEIETDPAVGNEPALTD